MCQVSGSGLNLQSVLLVLQQMMQRLDKTKREVDELQIQIQQQQEDVKFCRRYQERLTKVGSIRCGVRSGEEAEFKSCVFSDPAGPELCL